MNMNTFADPILIFEWDSKNNGVWICLVKFVDSRGCFSAKTDVGDLIVSEDLGLRDEQPVEILLGKIVLHILDL